MTQRNQMDLSNWTQIKPTSLPDVYLRELAPGEYCVSAYGGDEDGNAGPDDAAILSAVRLVTGNPTLDYASEWDVTNEAVAGEVVRTIR